jgi:transposase
LPVSKARLVITAVVIEGRSQAEVARAYGVSKGWVSKLVARYRTEGDAAFEPRSRRPSRSPAATPDSTVELVLEHRKQRVAEGLDAGPTTLAWVLEHRHGLRVSPATIWRVLRRAGGGSRGRRPATTEAAPLVLHPLPSGPAQRVLAG